MLKPIVVVGSINLDLVAQAKRLPLPGETILGTDFQTFHGGKGANQAVAVARLGHPVIMLGCVGNDSFGTQLLEGLREAGVTAENVRKVPGSSGIAVIVRADDAENSIIVIPGANHALRPADIDRHRSLLAGAGMVLAQLEIPLETVARLAEVCSEVAVPLMLDPAPAHALDREVLKRVSWLTPNESEARTLIQGTARKCEPRETAALLLADGAENVVLKMGEEGSYLCGQMLRGLHVPAFQVKAVDTTAAGDVFNGALAVALLRHEVAEDAARFASAAAAISVTRHGAQPSIPTADEVNIFLAEHGFARIA